MEANWKEDIIKNKLGGKKDWTDSERMELCHQLDKELNESLDSFSENKTIKDRWTEDNWREKMAEHPIFTPFVQGDKKDLEAPINELTEGLAQLKYDPEHNTPTELAQNYKEEGIHFIKFKNYRFAKSSFTRGINANCSDDVLNAQLYNNRAVAEFYVENYKSSLEDCCKAINLKPDYMKAIKRGLNCAEKLKSWDKMLELCEQGLRIDSLDEDLIKRKEFAITEKHKQMIELKKSKAAIRKQLNINRRLLKAIENRGIDIWPPSEVEFNEEDPSTLVQNLKPQLPTLSDNPVYLNDENELIWPVLLKYPEHEQTDSILEFNENTSFIDQFEAIFGPDVPPAPWDEEFKYKPENLLVYYTTYSEGRLVSVDPLSTLKNVYTIGRFEIKEGTPVFMIMVKGTKYAKEFVQNMSNSK